MHREYHGICCHPFFGHRHPWGRKFLTKEEKKKLKEDYKQKKIQWLEHYKESLEKEIAGINERLEELEKE